MVEIGGTMVEKELTRSVRNHFVQKKKYAARNRNCDTVPWVTCALIA